MAGGARACDQIPGKGNCWRPNEDLIVTSFIRFARLSHRRTRRFGNKCLSALIVPAALPEDDRIDCAAMPAKAKDRVKKRTLNSLRS